MNKQANPQDLLLAYDPDFVGFTSLASMALPLEREGDVAAPSSTGTLGGTADPDGYYDDFTARLDRFVRAHPRLGATGGGGGALDWKALVITLDGEGDSDHCGRCDGEGEGDGGGDGGDDGDYLYYGGCGYYSDYGGGEASDGGEVCDGEEGGAGGGDEPPLMSLGDYIVGVDGGVGSRDPATGEMDESGAEGLSYSERELDGLAPEELETGEQPTSLLDYLVVR